MSHSMRAAALPLVALLSIVAPGAVAQNRAYAPEVGTSNVHVLSHIPLGWKFTIADIDIEQELSRPYVYVQRDFGPAKFLSAGGLFLAIRSAKFGFKSLPKTL